MCAICNVWMQSEIVVKCIYKDNKFIEDCIENARHFFMYGILPGIVRKLYTRVPVAENDGTIPIPAAVDSNDDDDDDDDMERYWCYCNQSRFGYMIICDNKQCSIPWFHFDCLRIRTPPTHTQTHAHIHTHNVALQTFKRLYYHPCSEHDYAQ